MIPERIPTHVETSADIARATPYCPSILLFLHRQGLAAVTIAPRQDLSFTHSSAAGTSKLVFSHHLRHKNSDL